MSKIEKQTYQIDEPRAGEAREGSSRVADQGKLAIKSGTSYVQDGNREMNDGSMRHDLQTHEAIGENEELREIVRLLVRASGIRPGIYFTCLGLRREAMPGLIATTIS